MDIDETELPAVNLSPRKKRPVKEYIVPEPQILLKQRKEEDKSNEAIRRLFFINSIEEPGNISATTLEDSVNVSNDSEFSLPDADVIAAARIKENKENALLFGPMLPKEESPEKSNLTLSIGNLVIEQASENFPVENPGVKIARKFLKTLAKDPLTVKICPILKKISQNDGERLQMVLNHLLNVMTEMYSDDKIDLPLEDIQAQTILLCTIILDTKCKLILTFPTKIEVLHQVVNKVKLALQTEDTVTTLTKLILSHFSHFHNRFYLAQCLVMKCNPLEIETEPRFFCTRLAKSLLLQILCQLVGFEGNAQFSSFVDLKAILKVKGRMNELSPYEQLYLIKIVNELHWMFDASNIKNEDKTAKKWMIKFFDSLKCNSGSSRGFDYSLLKTQWFRIKLLWQNSDPLSDVGKE